MKLVAVTGYGQERDRARSEASGFDLHLVKPLDFAALNESLEELLWSLIPEAGHLRANVGTYDESERAVSHPLALTQLLVAYHMVKAAVGRHDA